MSHSGAKAQVCGCKRGCGIPLGVVKYLIFSFLLYVENNVTLTKKNKKID